MARDAGPLPSPSYLFVNINDLAVLQGNRPTSTVGRVLRSAVRYARFSGFLAAESAAGDDAVVFMPTALANMGLLGMARRTASRLHRYGIGPTVGWPGFTDQLWRRLAAGTP
jgi:hypothetical protein